MDYSLNIYLPKQIEMQENVKVYKSPTVVAEGSRFKGFRKHHRSTIWKKFKKIFIYHILQEFMSVENSIII